MKKTKNLTKGLNFTNLGDKLPYLETWAHKSQWSSFSESTSYVWKTEYEEVPSIMQIFLHFVFLIGCPFWHFSCWCHCDTITVCVKTTNCRAKRLKFQAQKALKEYTIQNSLFVLTIQLETNSKEWIVTWVNTEELFESINY